MRFVLEAPPAAQLATARFGTTVHLVEETNAAALKTTPETKAMCGARISELLDDPPSTRGAFKRCQKCASNEWSAARIRRLIR